MPIKSRNCAKTVYILGAGFSSPAGSPNQALLLKHIFNLPHSAPTVASAKRNLRQFLINAEGQTGGRE